MIRVIKWCSILLDALLVVGARTFFESLRRDDLSLLQLLDRAKVGDSGAFGELFESAKDELRRRLRAELLPFDRDLFGLDDVVQEVFVKALPALASAKARTCLLYTSPSPRDKRQSRMPSSA